MSILVIGMRYEFGRDVEFLQAYINYVLDKERKRHKIYHLNSQIVDNTKDVIIPDADAIGIEMRGEDFTYVMGAHFGRCLYNFGKLSGECGIVLNLSLLHPADRWTPKLKKNPFPLYLWGHKGFEQL